jgi:hypothetical protein
MPADRFVHKRVGHDDRVSGLTDLQARVWALGYLLAADDFGVMRYSSLPIQELNDALATRSARLIEQCLAALVAVGLLLKFESGGRWFVCSTSWQDDQHIRYPRDTDNPVPPPEIVSQCTEQTQELFRSRCRKIPEMPPEHSRKVSGTVPHLPRARARETAIGYRLEATGKRLPAEGTRPPAQRVDAADRDRFERFWQAYPKHVGMQAAWRSWVKCKPSEELLATMLAALAWQCQQDDWLRDGGRFVPHPSTWLNQGRWQDEPNHQPRVNERTLAMSRAVAEFVKP